MEGHEEELAVQILSRLVRNRRIGHKYLNTHAALSKVARDEWDVAKDVLEQLVRDGVLQEWKHGECVSIREDAVDQVAALLEDEVPDYFIDHYLHQHG